MSKLAYPKGRLLLVRDCTVDICLKNNPGAVLLSVLLFWYDNPHKGDWYNEGLHEFCMCRTQAEIEEASCHQIDVKTIHDTAIPLLRLLGYLHVGKKMHGDLYVLHMDRVTAAFAAYEQSLKQHDPIILKNHIRSSMQLEPTLIEMTEDELESALINKSRLYRLLERTLIRIREDSNCKRGPKPRSEAPLVTDFRNIEIIRDSIEIYTKREESAFAPLSLSSSEDNFSEEDEPPPTVKMPAVKLNGHVQQPPNETPYHIAGAIGNEGTHEPDTSISAHHPVGYRGIHGAAVEDSTKDAGGVGEQSLSEIGSEESLVIPPKFTLQAKIPSQQTPGVSLQDDQAQPSLLLDSEPAQAVASPTAGSVASGTTTAQASGGHVAQVRTQEKPKRGGRQKPVEEPVPEEAVRIMDDWDVLMKRACPRTTGEKGTIAAAVSLVPCHPSREILKSVWQFCFKSNPDWYRTHGVGLQDIGKNIGKWQSLQVPEEVAPPLVDAKKPANWIPADDDYSIAALAQIQERRQRREAERGV